MQPAKQVFLKIALPVLLFIGDLSEWLKEHAWKVCIRETVSRVRIPQSPHEVLFCISVQSKKDGSFYIRQCEDLDCRVSKHNDGFSTYTASKTPWRLK